MAGTTALPWAALVLVAVCLACVLPALLPYGPLLSYPAAVWEVWSEGVFWMRLGTTLAIAAATLALAIPLGLGQGWLLARSDVPGRSWLLAAAPAPLFLPPLAHVLSWFGWLGFTGFPAIVLVYVISFTPFVTLLTVKALEQTSRDHAESLTVLGGRVAVVIEDFRQALPAAALGGALALVFIVSDFAVADFLTAVGPKVTVYADSLYRHHLALRPGGVAAAALPGLLLCALALVWTLRRQRRLGESVSARFAPAPDMALGRARWWWFGALLLTVGAGSVFPIVALMVQTGSLTVLMEQFHAAKGRLAFTLMMGAGAATGLVLLALPLALLARRWRRPWTLDLVVFLPLATPALLFGLGLVQLWNRPGFDWLYQGVGVLWIALTGRYLALAYLPLQGVLERLDTGMFDAARLAGAGAWSRLWHVLLPLVRSPLLLIWCWSFGFTLRELDTLIMLGAGQRSLTFHLYANVVFSRPDETAAIALLLAGATFLPLLVFVVCFRRALRPRFDSKTTDELG